MNPSVLTMDPTEAELKAAAYETSRVKNDEYQAAAEIYRLLADGETVIDAGVAIREGGFDEKGRPKLAIARADREQVCFEWRQWDDAGAFNANASANWGRQFPSLIERVNFNRRPKEYLRGFALVPMIPADVRPAGNPRDWYILWEVEEWSETHIGPRPPYDPYLLRRVRGDVFVVLAQWDLTEVERYVMQGRARIQS